MSADLIIQVSHEVGLNLTRVEDDVLIGQNDDIYVMHTKLRHFVEHQIKYGTGHVHYSPNPLLLLEPEIPVERKDIILFISSQLRQDIEYEIKQIFDDTIVIVNESKLLPERMLTLFRNVKLVIAEQIENPDIFIFLIGAAVPFIALEGNLGFANILLESMSLSGFVLERDETNMYLKLSRCLVSIKRRYDKIASIMSGKVAKYRRIMSVVSLASGFRDIAYDNKLYPNVPNEYNLSLAISPGDYAHNIGLAKLSQQLSSYQNRGGIHVEISIFDTFLTFKSIYMHPWIGFIDSLDLDDYKNLVENFEFKNSISMCIGLIAFSAESAGYMQASLDAMNHKTLVITLPIPMNKTTTFDLKMWSDEPVLKHQGKRDTLLFLNQHGEKRVLDETITSSSSAHPESVIVLTQQSDTIFDILYYHISNTTPVILAPTTISKFLLGEDYPLFTENLKPYQLRDFITVDKVEQALHHLNKRQWCNMEKFLDLLSRTKIGCILKNIYS